MMVLPPWTGYKLEMLITMSDKEIQRLAVLQDVRDHRITQVRAAEILNLSTRQITRLLQKLNQDGISGLVVTRHISCHSQSCKYNNLENFATPNDNELRHSQCHF